MKYLKVSQAESCGLGLVHRWAESDDEAEDAGWTEEPQL